MSERRGGGRARTRANPRGTAQQNSGQGTSQQDVSGPSTANGSVSSITSGISQMSVVAAGTRIGEGSSSAETGRGSTRGGRQIPVGITKTRPNSVLSTKAGSTGQPVRLQANYFRLLSKVNWTLYQYRVDFSPDVDLTGERKRLLRVHQKSFNGQYLFDGTVLYVPTRLPNVQELYSARESDGSQIRITIKFVSDLVMSDAHYIQVFNIITRNALRKLDLQMIKRDYFDPKSKVEVREFCLELWPGYSTTIRQHEQSIMMCADIQFKVLRTDTCHHLLRDLVGKSRDFKADFAKQVIGSVVLTDYNNKSYVVSDVDWTQSPSSSFKRGDTLVTYVNYYKERYNIVIRDAGQPLLVSKSRPRERRAVEQKAVNLAGDDPNLILLVPELCRMTGLTDEMRSNFKLMSAMATHTRINPNDRIERLMAMNRRLNQEPRVREEFDSWNMKLDTQLVDVPGRILPQEQIVLGNLKTVPAGNECDWTRDLRGKPMFAMPQGGLSKWVLIYPTKVHHDVEAFVSTLQQAGKGMSFPIAQPQYMQLNDDRNQSYVQALDQAISNYSPQLIFCVLFNAKADKYSAIKKRSLVDRAVPTQVLLAKNLNKKGVMSIATKVAIQLNCKIGGAPWSIQMPLPNLMVIGFDVCHDAKSKGRSFGAMVASLNKPMSRYFSAVSHHSTGEELSNDLALNIVKALICYRRHNKILPSHVVLFRDGVGDGQIPYVFDHEVQRINAAMRELYGTAPVKFAFIIVSKRINTRFFYNRKNPVPGTVIDDVVTLPERYDFFLVSQFVNQGTVSPTSYNVIHDTLGLDPDKIQKLSHKMTHSYYNWSGTVRVPAPVQYAHKLAFLTSQSLNRPPNPALEELLYFL